MYTELDAIETEDGIKQFETTLRDRFGKVSNQVYVLFDALRVRWLCKRLGFERLILKNHKLRCYFVENPQSPYFETATFNAIFQFIGKEGHKLGLSFKKSQKYLFLVKDNMKSMKKAHSLLSKIAEGIDQFRN